MTTKNTKRARISAKRDRRVCTCDSLAREMRIPDGACEFGFKGHAWPELHAPRGVAEELALARRLLGHRASGEEAIAVATFDAGAAAAPARMIVYRPDRESPFVVVAYRRTLESSPRPPTPTSRAKGRSR